MTPDQVFSILMTASLKFRETLQHILATNPDIPANVRGEMETELAQITEAIDTVFKTGEAAMEAAKAEEAAPGVDPEVKLSGGIYQNPPA